MPCQSFGSSSEVKLYYAVDDDPLAAIPATQIWETIRMTGESLDANISASISDEITPQRSFADSTPSQGEVTGGFNMEMSFDAFDTFIKASLQTSAIPPIAWATGQAKSLGDEVVALTNQGLVKFVCTTAGNTDSATEPTWDATPGTTTNDDATDGTAVWTCHAGQFEDGAIQNESTKYCLMFLKVVVRSGGTDYYTYRGCQVDGITMSMQPGANITGTVSLQGTGVAVSTSPGGSWVYNASASKSIMSGTDSLQNLDLSVAGGASLAVTFQSLEVQISNQLRQQQAVGTGSIYAAGVASGRFQCTVNSAQYYSDADVFTNFTANTNLQLDFDLTDSEGNSYAFLMGKLKVTGGGVPLAGGPDQDLLINPTMQAFEHGTNGTVKVTKTTI